VLTVAFLAAVFALAGCLAMPPTSALAGRASPPEQARALAYGKLPLSFEANQGQADPQVRFIARGDSYTLFLTPTEAVLALRRPRAGSGETSLAAALEEPARPAALRMKLVGAAPAPVVEGLEERPGRVHYYRSSNPAEWRTNIPTYGKVRYGEVYPGVDLIYYGNRRQLEYDLVLAPGADPGTIRLAFEGADRLELDPPGGLCLHAAEGKVCFLKPRIYQVIEGSRRPVPGDYILRGGHQVGFQVAAYDASKPLVIDPVVEVYLTYLGGSSDENTGSGTGGIAVNAQGQAYVTGTSSSTVDFPGITSGDPPVNGDIFVTKFNVAGSDLVYNVILGGGAGARSRDIAVDADGNAYVTGRAEDGHFPLVNAYQATGSGAAFLTKLDNSGVVQYSTLLDGAGQVEPAGVAVDPDGNAYIAGFANSLDLPTKSPDPAGAYQKNDDPLLAGDARNFFVAKFDPSKSGEESLVYLTYLGGTGFEENFGQMIAVDAQGQAYVTGYTASADFPTRHAFQQACALDANNTCSGDLFVAKLNAAGSDLVYSTFLGGTDVEGDIDMVKAASIAVDADGNAYVTSGTMSSDFPAPTPLPGTACPGRFVAKLAFDEATSTLTLAYSTCGVGSRGIAVDGQSRIYLGDTMLDLSKPGADKIVYAGVGPAGIEDVAIDASCNAYVTGKTNVGPAGHGPLGPYQLAPKGSDDAYVAKLGPGGPFAYIANANGTVTVIDTASNTLFDTDPATAGVQADIPVGLRSEGVAVHPDGTRVYVANFANGTVSVIDTTTTPQMVTQTLMLGCCVRGVAVSPDGTRLYVTQTSGLLTVFDTTANNMLDSTVTPNPVSTGGSALGVAVTPDGSKVYVTNSSPNSVSVVTFPGGTATVTTIPLGFQDPTGVAIAPTSPPKAYVTHLSGVSVIDTANDQLIKTLLLGRTQGVAAHPDGTRVYVTHPFRNTVSVINTVDDEPINTGTVNGEIEVGGRPTGLKVHPDGTRVYVLNRETAPPVDVADNPPGLEDPGDPPGDDEGPSVSVIDTVQQRTVFLVSVPSSSHFGVLAGLGQFIGPLPLVDQCVPLEALMQLRSLMAKVDNLGLPRGVKAKFQAELRKALRLLEKRRSIERVEGALDHFIRRVNKLAKKQLTRETAGLLLTAARRVLNTLP
jgi:YVTN family beta-propeller protein